MLEKLCVEKSLKAVVGHYDIEDLDQLVLVVTEMLVSQGLTFTDTLVRQLILEINADTASILNQ